MKHEKNILCFRGIIYLHDSPIGFHGNLKTNNCLVDSRWVLKLTDFGQQIFQTDWLDYHDYLSQPKIDEEICENLLHRQTLAIPYLTLHSALRKL